MCQVSNAMNVVPLLVLYYRNVDIISDPRLSLHPRYLTSPEVRCTWQMSSLPHGRVTPVTHQTLGAILA